jgi:hypothetical protein
MKNAIFIHTNAKQIVGAIVSAHTLKRQSRHPQAFDVNIVRKEDHGFFRNFEGRKYLRSGGWRTWRNDDLQSFTPTRFMPPELMQYEGKAIVTDPDVFAIGDVNELFSRNMQGKAVLARRRPGHNRRADYIATSVMLLDCAKLTHWKVEQQFADMFEGKLDYEDWIILKSEPKGSIGFLEDQWNDFDTLTPSTKMLHNTKRNTQPWKTGLPIDYTNRVPFFLGFLPINGIKIWGKYKRHADHRQEELFFSYAKECMETGALTEKMLRDEMAKNHVRHDAIELLNQARRVDVILQEVRTIVRPEMASTPSPAENTQGV